VVVFKTSGFVWNNTSEGTGSFAELGERDNFSLDRICGRCVYQVGFVLYP